MSALAQHAEEYLRLRHALGHKLADAVRLLPRFVAHLDAAGVSTITAEVALAWVQQPETCPPTSSVWFRRMTVVRGFARHMSGIDPATEIPPFGLVTFRPSWRPPFIYSEADVEALMGEVPRLVPTPLRAATFRTMIGLLAVSGMRVGEVIAMAPADIDWAHGVVIVRSSKFAKSREVPVHPTTLKALADYAAVRDSSVSASTSPTFFCASKGTPVIYTDFGYVFRRLVAHAGVGADSPSRSAQQPPDPQRPAGGAAIAVSLRGAPTPRARAVDPAGARHPPEALRQDDRLVPRTP
jgi:integrase/recombinase XerD